MGKYVRFIVLLCAVSFLATPAGAQYFVPQDQKQQSKSEKKPFLFPQFFSKPKPKTPEPVKQPKKAQKKMPPVNLAAPTPSTPKSPGKSSGQKSTNKSPDKITLQDLIERKAQVQSAMLAPPCTDEQMKEAMVFKERSAYLFGNYADAIDRGDRDFVDQMEDLQKKLAADQQNGNAFMTMVNQCLVRQTMLSGLKPAQ